MSGKGAERVGRLRPGLAVWIALGAVFVPGAMNRAFADFVFQRDGRAFFELEDVSGFAVGQGRPPFDDSVLGYFDGINFILLGLPGPSGQFSAFSRAASSAVDRVPVPSGATSVMYRYDPALEAFMRIEGPMSPAISQNARSNGRGVVTFGYAYTYLDYNEFDGNDRRRVLMSAFGGSVPNFDPNLSDPGVDFVSRFDYQLQQQIFAFSANYGALENLDVGVLVPLVDVSFRGRINGRFFGVTEDRRYRPLMFDESGNLEPDDRLKILFPNLKAIDNVAFAGLAVLEPGENPANAFSRVPLGIIHEESHFGIGDVVFRSRYHAATVGPVDLGGAFNVTTPTGDDDNLLGLPGWRLDPRLLASVVSGQGAAHANVGYHVDLEDPDRNRFDYAIGAEVRAYEWLTILVDHIGRMELQGDTQIRSFDVVPGVKINPYGNFILGFNVILPLNEEGLTTRLTPNGAVEATVVF